MDVSAPPARPARQVSFDVGNLQLGAKHWSNPEGIPTLALHGWLDNCASFDFLAPLLPQLDLLALDLAGHGLSESRNGRVSYNIWQDVAEVFAVADQLGWQQFSLIGHSRGAIIATLAAGTLPERVSQLALLEGICPQLGEPEDAPEQLARSIVEVNQQLDRQRRCYATFEEAVKARERGMIALCHIDARALAERGVEQTRGGFAWRYDPKLMAASELRLTRAQMDAFVARISAETQLVLGEEGLLNEFPALKDWLRLHPEIPTFQLPGTHHCHMSAGAESVAEAIRGLWA